jgi:hypothetical protein
MIFTPNPKKLRLAAVETYQNQGMPEQLLVPVLGNVCRYKFELYLNLKHAAITSLGWLIILCSAGVHTKATM